jgi:hypothetical protein
MPPIRRDHLFHLSLQWLIGATGSLNESHLAVFVHLYRLFKYDSGAPPQAVIHRSLLQKSLGTPAPSRAVFAESLPARARAYPGFSLFQGVATRQREHQRVKKCV